MKQNEESCEFAVRALELHSLYAWDYDWIIRCLDFMVQENFNTLILHRNDFIDLIIYPGKYFGCEKESYASIFERYKEIFRSLYKYTPTRRSSPYQRRAFFKRVLEQARRRGIQVYIENKELYFPEIILEFHPELVKEGKICANDPFWFEFTRVKFKEFFEEFPEVAGIITAPATGESKVSIKSNRCTCERCQNTPKEVWFKNLLDAMYEPIHAAGKRLVVRDFVFDPQAHAEISHVMEQLPSDVVISLKNTPHDYYPTFPENSRIGDVGEHEQWIEFDAMGQYFGWGIGIADLMEDYRRRMRHAKEKGADGVIFRTDWESLDGHTVFRTPNLMNLYSAGRLSVDLSVSAEEIYDRFLSREGWYQERATAVERRQACVWFSDIMSRTWAITRKTVFIDGCVFSDSSLMPISYEHAFWLAEEKNSLRDWDESKREVLSPRFLRLERAMAEKLQAYEEAIAVERLGRSACPGLRTEKLQWLRDRLSVQVLYVELFQVASDAICTARYLCETEEPKDGSQYLKIQGGVVALLQTLHEMERRLRDFHATTDYHPHTIYTLLDPDRVDCLWKDLSERLASRGLLKGDFV